MTSPRLLAAAAAAVLCAAAAPAFAATAGSGQVNANASGALVNALTGLPGTTSTQNDHAAGLPSSLHAHASVDVSNGGLNRVQTTSDVTATWDSATSGSLHTANVWQIDAHDPIAGVVVGATTIDNSLSSTQPAWQYAFDTTAGENLFTMGFGVDVTGDGFALGVWNLSIVEDGAAIVPLHQLSNGSAGGSFTQALTAGHHFVVTLTSNDGRDFITGPRPNDHIVGIEQSDFSWSITGQAGGGVPEPATWSLAILGFGLAGASLRRKARATGAA